MEKAKKLLTFFFLFIIVFTVFSLASESREKETVLVPDSEEIVRFVDSADGDIIETYPEKLLVQIEKNDIGGLKRKTNNVELLGNRKHVSVSSGSFKSSEKPGVTDKFGIQTFRGTEDHEKFIIQFIGPIKEEWKKKLEEMGIELLEYRQRYNFIADMDPGQSGIVEDLSFVNWVGGYRDSYKIHDSVGNKDELQKVSVSVFDREELDNAMEKAENYGEIIESGRNSFKIRTDKVEELASFDNVKEIRESHDISIEFFNREATWISETNKYENRKITEKGVTGENEIITVMDSELYMEDGGHEMWRDEENDVGDQHRKVQDIYAPEGFEGVLGEGELHGTHVVGTVLGDSSPHGEYSNNDGNAIGARLIFQDIGSDSEQEVDIDKYYDTLEDVYDTSKTQTNSWGYSELHQNHAGRQADEFIWNHDDFNVVFAMGNDGSEEETLTVPARGKSVISVGSVDTYGAQDQVVPSSSRGYANDGRIKPTVMHVGEDVNSAYRSEDEYITFSGTSMAAPGVAGNIGQIRQYYREGWHESGSKNTEEGFNPSNSLVRATLINSAVEVSGSGAYYNDQRFPNNDQGYGRIKLNRTLYFEGESRYLDVYDSWEHGNSLDTGETWTKEFEVYDNSKDLEVTLAWNDYPDPNPEDDDPAIVNDLDLELEAPDGTRFVGNAFEGYDPGFSEPDPEDNYWSGLRDGEFDGLNVEQTILLLPEYNGVDEGTYEITVTGHNVPEEEQDFAVVISGGIESEKPLKPVDPEPEDGSENVELDPELSVYVEHEDSDSDMDVEFFDGEDQLIGTDTDVGSGERASVEWENREHSSQYEWYAVAVDGNEQSESDVFSFSTKEIDYINVLPDEVTIEAGETQEYTATGYSSDGTELEDKTDETDWSDNIEESTWDQNMLTPETAGENFEVTGEYDEYLDQVQLDVEPSDPYEIVFDEIGEQMAGEAFEVKLEILDEYGNRVYDYSEDISLSDSTGTVQPEEVSVDGGIWQGDITISDLETDVVITAEEETGELTGESNSFDVTGETGYVDINPAEDKKVLAGEEIQFDASAYDENGNLITEDVTEFTWTDIDEKDEDSNRALFNETDTGEYTVQATYEENGESVKSAQVEVLVDIGDLENIDVNPHDIKEIKNPVVDINNTKDGYGNQLDQKRQVEFEIGGKTETELLFDDGDTRFVMDDLLEAGTHDATVKVEELEETESFEVEQIDIDDFYLEPEDSTIYHSEWIEYQAVAVDDQGNEYDVNDETDFEVNASDENREWDGSSLNVDKKGVWEVNGSYRDQEFSATLQVEILKHDVTFGTEGEGSINISEETKEFRDGEKIVLNATPEEHWYLDSWKGIESENKEETSFTVDEDKDVTAVFAQNEYEINLEIDGDGSVEKEPEKEKYEPETEVNLTAKPGKHWNFKNWTGDNESQEEKINITMDEDKHFTANFEEEKYVIDLEIDGEGSVEKEPDNETYEPETEVNLTAKPGKHWNFKNWTGDRESEEKEIELYMDGNKELTTNFVEKRYSLDIDKEGEGSVDVYPDKESYEPDTVVDLVAYPDTGFEFDGWTGDYDLSASDISFPMDSDKYVKANFVSTSDDEETEEEDEETDTSDRSPPPPPEEYELKIEYPVNQGYVSVEYSGVELETDEKYDVKDRVEEVYVLNNEVTLDIEASPEEGFVFDEWSGDIEGDEEKTEVHVDEDKTIQASFNELFELKIGEPVGEGTTEPEAGTHDYLLNSKASLEAKPEDGWFFEGWRGDIEKEDKKIDLVIEGDTELTPYFEEYLETVEEAREIVEDYYPEHDKIEEAEEAIEMEDYGRANKLASEAIELHEGRTLEEEAETLITNTKNMINESEPGYDTLLRAQDRMESGEYEEAMELAKQAIKQYRNKEPVPKERETRSMALTAILVIFGIAAILGGVFVYWKKYRYRKPPKYPEKRKPQKHAEKNKARKPRGSSGNRKAGTKKNKGKRRFNSKKRGRKPGRKS